MNDNLSLLLNSFNDPQRQTVVAPPGRQLVPAGADSGKIRVLVHRIAWLVQVRHTPPYSILLMAFTSKAATEMHHRIEQSLGINPAGTWVGTLHGLVHHLLRAHWREAGLNESLQILDSDDQQRLVKRMTRELGLDGQHWPAHQAQWLINGQKDEDLRPQYIQPGGDLFLATMLKIYGAHETACARAGVIDFSELLPHALDLWRDHPGVLKHHQRRFRHILVDESQDANVMQYAWLRILAKDDDNLMVVGDDDQSAYGWRGARIENIQQFSGGFTDAEVIRLEQNYRFTASILKVVSALIANNQGRLGEELQTDGEGGKSLSLYAAFNEHDGARYMIESIESVLKGGLTCNEIAILYRSDAQSRVLEEALLREKIPYRIYGDRHLFERTEIKSVMAYLRLLDDRGNDAALGRVANMPAHGIGKKTVRSIREFARGNDVPMWEMICLVIINKVLLDRAASALTGFVELIENLSTRVMDIPLYLVTQTVIGQSGLIDYRKEEKGERGQARAENLGELVGVVRAFESSEEEEDLTPLQAFLSHVPPEAGGTQADAREDSVRLMTLRSAKDLELSLVFLAGMEEGLFPHKMNLGESGRLGEERHLTYVSATRAIQ